VRRACSALSLLIGTGLVTTLVSAVAAEPRAVVELFTSQGCSSCPAADKLLGELAKDPSVVAISLSIDYWDYLGWRDTLALPGHSLRQRAYARSRGDRKVYTPQVVVNGSVHVLGSDQGAIERAIEQTRRNAGTLAVPITASLSGGTLTVSVPEAKAGASNAGEVWLCAMTRSVPVQVERGENRGRTITYHNVARRWHKLGDWNGQAGSWTVAIKDLNADGVDSAAVILQDGSSEKPGPMLGAAVAAIH
jgi:hypothetical protein